eukprot:SAG11_NODE_3024_length_2755_cov_0.965361_2_plen_461_part_00
MHTDVLEATKTDAGGERTTALPKTPKIAFPGPPRQGSDLALPPWGILRFETAGLDRAYQPPAASAHDCATELTHHRFAPSCPALSLAATTLSSAHHVSLSRCCGGAELKDFVVELCMQWIEQKHNLLLNRRVKWPKGMESKGEPCAAPHLEPANFDPPSRLATLCLLSVASKKESKKESGPPRGSMQLKQSRAPPSGRDYRYHSSLVLLRASLTIDLLLCDGLLGLSAATLSEIQTIRRNTNHLCDWIRLPLPNSAEFGRRLRFPSVQIPFILCTNFLIRHLAGRAVCKLSAESRRRKQRRRWSQSTRCVKMARGCWCAQAYRHRRCLQRQRWPHHPPRVFLSIPRLVWWQVVVSLPLLEGASTVEVTHSSKRLFLHDASKRYTDVAISLPYNISKQVWRPLGRAVGIVGRALAQWMSRDARATAADAGCRRRVQQAPSAADSYPHHRHREQRQGGEGCD